MLPPRVRRHLLAGWFAVTVAATTAHGQCPDGGTWPNDTCNNASPIGVGEHHSPQPRDTFRHQCRDQDSPSEVTTTPAATIDQYRLGASAQ